MENEQELNQIQEISKEEQEKLDRIQKEKEEQSKKNAEFYKNETEQERAIRIQNERIQRKNHKRELNKQTQSKQKNERHLPEVWKVGEDKYKEEIRQDLGVNKNGKPKMPVIFFKWTEKHEQKAHSVLDQDTQTLDEEQYEKYENTANKQWDKFYKNHKLGFFHHRYYLRREFPELVSIGSEERKNTNYILTELGCGVGDTIFPLKIEYPNLNLQASDFSSKAIEWVKKSEEYDTSRVKAAVMDLVNDDFPEEFLPSDLVTLIFCFSAISPENHQKVINKIYNWMKPGSIIYFRDYGKYDFAQINFSRKKGRKLKDNFYVKHDGTRCYYATEQEISDYFKNAGFEQKECKAHYRYLENRKTGLEMYRVWIQGRFMKPGEPIFDHYGPIQFEEKNLDADKKYNFQEEQDQQDGGESHVGKLDQKIQEKLEEKLQQNEKLLDEQINQQQDEQKQDQIIQEKQQQQ